MLYNKISELTQEDNDIKVAKIERIEQELWAKKDKNDTNIKSSGLNVILKMVDYKIYIS